MFGFYIYITTLVGVGIVIVEWNKSDTAWDNHGDKVSLVLAMVLLGAIFVPIYLTVTLLDRLRGKD